MTDASLVRRLVPGLILSLSLGCASTVSGGAGAPLAVPDPGPEIGPEIGPEFGPWQATVAVDHPLVGTAWSVTDDRALTRAELEQGVATARFVLLGETHDHPDHHRLQGELITHLLGTGGLAVAYEMLDPARQAEIDAFVAAGSADVDGFAELVAWADSGWPAWSLYRPAFAPVIEAKLPILAAQFPRAQTRRFMSEGLAMLPAETVARYGLDQPLAPAQLDAQLDEMFASHCEMVPREQLAPMVEIQRVRDAVMADALLEGAAAHGRAVLVAGTGHTRASGVPRLLERAGASGVISVGLVAVDPARLDPRAYGEDFDVLVWTPDIEREDPCVGLSAG